MRLDDRLQALKASDAWHRVAVRGAANDGSEDRHGATVDIDERLRNNEPDDLCAISRCAIVSYACPCTDPLDKFVCDVIPSFVKFQKA